jgi:PAP2 superfamily
MVRSWLSRSHSGLQELGALVLLYGVYEVVRGAPDENLDEAMRHTSEIVALEQGAGIYVEHGVQQGLDAVPGLPTLLGLAYLSLHFAGTAAALVWVHRRHPERFPVIRTTVVVATALALVGYVLYPAAPPRLADLGFQDTVTSSAGVNLSSDLLGALYNPFAAVPSLHFGYALIVGVTVATLASNVAVRAAAALYPAAMLVVIVSTGNHFFFDAVLGGMVVGVGWLVALVLVDERLARGASRARQGRAREEQPCVS